MGAFELFIEIRFHGRGGQGVVSASRILAEAAMVKGLYVQAMPEFGAERSGAPIAAYTRLSDEPIEIHSFIYEPDMVLVIDKSLAINPMIKAGLKKDGRVIANFSGTPEELKRKLDLPQETKVMTIDASKIALDTIGRDIPNTPILGAFARVCEYVDLESIGEALAARFKGTVLEKNKEALKVGYQEAEMG